MSLAQRQEEFDLIYIKRLILMIQFLTTIPVRINLNVTSEDFGKGLVFAPIVGLFIGGILSLVHKGTVMIFSAGVSAVLVVTAYILLTGGLHLDGLGDTFDGIFSNRPKERILEIMRDSRVGTNAVLAIGCILMLNVSLLGNLEGKNLFSALVLMPVAGRIGSLVGAGSSSYARSGEGLGKSFIDYCGAKEIIAGLLIYFPIFWCTAGYRGLLIGAIPPVTAYLTVKFFAGKIGGATGDVLGAVCELNQTMFLIAVYIIGI